MDELDRAVEEQNSTGAGSGEPRVSLTQKEIDQFAAHMAGHMAKYVKGTGLTREDFHLIISQGFKNWGLVAK